MDLSTLKTQAPQFFRRLYRIWFPWLDVALLASIYFFLWGEAINPYRQYQLITYGKTVSGKISGEDGLFANSDSPRMRDFNYTFVPSNAKSIKSASHAFGIDEVKKANGKFPVTATILYLPNDPQINWIKSDLPSDLTDLLKRNLIFGSLFILLCYLIGTVVIRLSILDYREEKRMKEEAKKESGNSLLWTIPAHLN